MIHETLINRAAENAAGEGEKGDAEAAENAAAEGEENAAEGEKAGEEAAEKSGAEAAEKAGAADGEAPSDTPGVPDAKVPDLGNGPDVLNPMAPDAAPQETHKKKHNIKDFFTKK